jgi:hypothetical protein
MTPRRTAKNRLFSAAAAAVALSAFLASALSAQTGPTATPPYTISVFATSQNGYSQPDSITRWRNSILIGFGNGVAKDCTDGKSSTIVQYSLSGVVERTFSVIGHNDGLRLQPNTNKLWALQCEDGNPNLVIIDLETGAQSLFAFPPTPHGGGYDDATFRDGQVYITASNPTLNGQGVNVFPALVRVTGLAGGVVTVEPVLFGNATAIDIPTGTTITLNLTDPDSLTVDDRGNIVLDSQADSELVFVRNPLTANQTVGRLSITSSGAATTLDDTAFATSPEAFLLVSDLSGDAIYRIDAMPWGFEPGVAYSASDTVGIVATLNLDTGALTSIVTGLVSGRGELFVSPAGARR